MSLNEFYPLKSLFLYVHSHHRLHRQHRRRAPARVYARLEVKTRLAKDADITIREICTVGRLRCLCSCRLSAIGAIRIYMQVLVVQRSDAEVT